ncbi:PP2C family serine/threonine-protein phosphatase [Streptomyces sp. NPDC057552]|uniref:PP2C family serine/threonine-protein phosphatase n=1 Tax=Streptomyces sp. NPDC057552 TaxID=3350537 RepID=UPI00368F5F1A
MNNNRSSSTAALNVVVATASREGTQGPIADAVRHYVAADHTTAVAVIDGAGHEADVVAIAPILAEVAARNAAQHGAVHGVLSAAALVTDRGPNGDGPRAVAAVVVCPPEGETKAAFTGDCAIFGSDGERLHRYSSAQTVAGLIQDYLQITVPLPFTTHDHLRSDLTTATLNTVPGVLIPENELVLIVSDGVDDTVSEKRLQELAIAHADDPQRLADEVAAAAGLNEAGYRDDATVAVVLRPAARTALLPSETDEADRSSSS